MLLQAKEDTFVAETIRVLKPLQDRPHSDEAGHDLHPPPYSQTPAQSDLPAILSLPSTEVYESPTLNSTSISPTRTSDRRFKSIRTTNYFRSSRIKSSVKGKWRIDTDMRIPPGLLDPLPEGETSRHHLSLESKQGNITADVGVEGETKALILGKSETGEVLMTVRRLSTNLNEGVAENGPALDIKCKTKSGPITLYLPRDFEGPISWRSCRGTATFSSAVQARLTRFGQRVEKGPEYGFIGDWVGSGYGQDATKVGEGWNGDEACLESTRGALEVYFEDEKDVVGSVLWAVRRWLGGS